MNALITGGRDFAQPPLMKDFRNEDLFKSWRIAAGVDRKTNINAMIRVKS
jgi:hypothetical protein